MFKYSIQFDMIFQVYQVLCYQFSGHHTVLYHDIVGQNTELGNGKIKGWNGKPPQKSSLQQKTWDTTKNLETMLAKFSDKTLGNPTIHI